MKYVVVGIIRKHNKVLLSLRGANVDFPNQWEFPGGEIERGETEFEALKRELREEIGIELLSAKRLVELTWQCADGQFQVSFFMVQDYKGEPESCEHQPLQWVEEDNLLDVTLIPPDAKAARIIAGKDSF